MAPAATSGPEIPAAEALTPAVPAATTPAGLVFRAVDGSTVGAEISPPPAAATTPSPTVIIPDAPPAEVADEDDPSGPEEVDPAAPPGFRDAFGSYLLGVVAGGAGPSAANEPVAAPDPSAGDAAERIDAGSAFAPATPATGVTGIVIAPETVIPAAAPVLPPAERPDVPPVPAEAGAGADAIPVAILPPPASRVPSKVVSAAVRYHSIAHPVRPHRLSPQGVANAVKGAGEVTIKASRSPWLPLGLLALGLLYLLGQRAMDRGSKLSYAGRAGEPDDELIEL